jgi:hypothetical protein
MKITTQIQGGLGNQLFQYATGKALSERLGGQLLVDIDWFNHEWIDVTPREFLLPFLNVQLETTQVSPPIQSPRRWRRIAQQILPLNPYVLNDRPYRFNPALTQFKPFENQDIYLMGYWQSFRYFDSIRQELIHEIRPINQLSPQYQIYLEKIKGCLSAMIHIRRGDYRKLADDFGLLPIKYYTDALNSFNEDILDRPIWIFTDSPQDVSAEIIGTSLEGAEIMSHLLEVTPNEIISIMSKANRIVISNSTFSWWAAYLSKKDTKIVAPEKWFRNRQDPIDLIPPTWSVIRNGWC